MRCVFLGTILAIGCSSGGLRPDGGLDTGMGADAGPGVDAGSGVDAGHGVDAGLGVDAGHGVDAGRGVDAGPGVDAGFPECERADASMDYCPRMSVELCRLELLRREMATGCAVDSDCMLVAYSANCLTYGLCDPRPAILVAKSNDFSAAVAQELNLYCAGQNCSGGLCAPLQTEPFCEMGICQTRVVLGGDQ